jgi:hypothetical protein
MNLLAQWSFREVKGQKSVQGNAKIDLFLQNIMPVEDEKEAVMAEEKVYLVD